MSNTIYRHSVVTVAPSKQISICTFQLLAVTGISTKNENNNY